MIELDVHVLLSPNTKPEWQQQCLRSIGHAVQRAGFPVHVHPCPAIPGDVGAARAVGYAKGSAPWKTYVDDDDHVLPDAFEVLGQHLASTNAAAVFPREYVMQNGHMLSKINARHHLCTYRADVVAAFPLRDWPVMCDLALQLTATADPRGVLDINQTLYVHRVYANSGGRRLRLRSPAERARIVELDHSIRGIARG